MPDHALVLDYADITLANLPQVGGKNASCGELLRHLQPLGIGVVDGFATTAHAWRRLLQTNNLRGRLRDLLAGLDPEDTDELARRGAAARQMVLDTPLPDELAAAIRDAHQRLCQRLGGSPALAVRSSATAEDLPDASFAGQHESFLNVDQDHLLDTVRRCMASLFTDRAIVYRQTRGFDHDQVALSVGVQPMVRSDIGVSGVVFTLDTESGFSGVVETTASWGLGEAVVQGSTTPDEWTVSKVALESGKSAIVGRTLGAKATQLVFGEHGGTLAADTPPSQRRRFCLNDNQVTTIAR